jgi:type VI secretion system secreted protein VgrG
MAIDEDVKGAADTTHGIVHDLMQRLKGDQLPTVDYEVEFHGLDGDEHLDWRVRRFHLSEGLSQCYETTLDLLNPKVTANCDELLGQPMTLHVIRPSAIDRMVHGIVSRVEYIGITADNLMVRMNVVPAFRLLEQRVDCRVFQDQSVPEIVEEVIGTGLGAFDRTFEMRDGLTPDARENYYAKRDYCVQYNESDLDFVSRLMEEEGISYFFEHDPEDGDGTKELLVLVDQRGDNPNAGCPATPIIDPEGDDEIPIIADRPDTADTESIQAFRWSLLEKTLKVHERGFNWKAPDPSSPPEGTAEPRDEASGGTGTWEPEIYVYGEHHKTVDAAGENDFNGTGLTEDADSALRWFELNKRMTREGSGGSNVVNLSPGYWFRLRGHPHDVVDELAEFLLIRVIHFGDCPDVERQGGSSEHMNPRYENTFVCIPRATKFRPAKTTPRPRMHGPHTATVTGSGNEEIHTDKHGRIKVKFHWDRYSPLDDTAACWVRVAQAWAGPGWGSLFIPRVGMEVVVEFIAGNPDDPLVTGCVYNGLNAPPYTLPDERTKSTIKSNSSPGGGGFNELRFEDAKGSEEVFLHAEKNYNEVVKSAHTTSVGSNQTHTVGGDRVRVVKGSETITIEGNQTIVINGASQDEGTDGGCEVTGKMVTVHDTYKLGTTSQIVFDAPDLFVLTVGSSTITVEPEKITFSAGGGAEIVLDGDIKATAAGGSQLLMNADIAGKSSARAKLELSGITARLSSALFSSVVLDANAAVKAVTGASLKLTGDAALKGGTITAKSDAGDVKIDSDGVVIKGPAIKLAGSKAVTVKGGGATGKFSGGKVKLN